MAGEPIVRRCRCGCGRIPPASGFVAGHEQFGDCKSELERFLKFVKKQEGCWAWTGCLNSDGYGQFGVDGKVVGAHIVSARLFRADYNKALQVLHSCDNPPCVNPDHLFQGTNADNVADRVAKGRSASMVGSRNPRAILNEDQVREIRQLRRAGMGTLEISQKFKIRRDHCRLILGGRRWKLLK